MAIPAPKTTRRLSTRRGSVTAFDPFGTHNHINSNSNIQSSSTLTIVRITSPLQPQQQQESQDPSSSPRRYTRRLAGNNNNHNNNQPSSDSTRLSFAFSSFSGGPSTIPRPSSPQYHGPSSPQHHRLSLSSLPNKPRLSPEQLFDLARSSTSPRPPSQVTPPSYSPLLRPHSPLAQNQTITTPATFTPLPDDIYLPFIHRPSEVSALITSPPSVKLFALLAQTFRDHPVSTTPINHQLDLPLNPEKWSYPQLHHHLTVIDRSQIPDFLWVLQARKCILAHSELIWERIKGALGVPPELDIDYDPSDDDLDPPESSSRSISSIDTDEISDDHGRGARGHWDDWDAVMDSPVFDRRPATDPSSPVIPISLSSNRFSTEIDLSPVTTASFSAARSLNPDVTSDITVAPTPVGTGALSPPHPISSASRSPASPGTFLSIEPILFSSISPSPNTSANPPPLSLATSEVTGLGLGDIQEGAEEEGEENEEPKEETQAEEVDPDMISPTQIQGLRISTTPLGPTPSFPSPRPMSPVVQPIPASTTTSSTLSAAYVAPSPISPLPPYPSTTNTGPFQSQSRTHSRSGSASSLTGPFRRSGSFSSTPFQRTSSWGSIPGAGPEYARGSGSEYGSEQGEGEGGGGYDPVGDRAPGNPLFPGNFARLAIGPTLVANNPALRSPQMPPPSRYVPLPGGGVHGRSALGGGQPKMRTFSHGAFGDARGGKVRVGGRPLSWGVGRVGGGGDYAVTVAESSAGGSERGEGS